MKRLVELLFFSGCPNYERYLPRLRELIASSRVPAELKLRRVDSIESAQNVGFLGSPTVRIDGRDVEPAAQTRTDFGLQCRLYRSPEGWSGVPPDACVLQALTPETAGRHTQTSGE